MAAELFDPLAYRKQQAQSYQDSVKVNTPPPAPQEAKSYTDKLYGAWYDAGVLTPDSEKKGFWRKVGEDALSLGLAPAAMGTTALDAVFHPIKTSEKVAGGFVQGVKDMFDVKQWEAHPLTNLVNTVGNVSIVGGLAKSAATGAAKNAAMSATRTAALETGVEESAIKAALKNNSAPLKEAVMTASKTGKVDSVGTVLQNTLTQMGVEEYLAGEISRSIAKDVVGDYFVRNAGKLKAIDAVANPIKTLGENYNLIGEPVRNSIFGEVEKSAVGKLYGSEMVARNPKGFGMIEEWAGMQAAERGIADSMENRVRIIQDWVKENSEYAALTPEQRIAHFENYARADVIRERFAGVQGRDYVLTKALPKDYVQSIVEYIDSLPKDISNSKILDELNDHYGKDFALHYEEVRRRLTGTIESTERKPLIKAIEALGNNRIPINIRRLSKAEQEFLTKLEGSGYRIGRAPKSKTISQAAGIIKRDDPLIREAQRFDTLKTFISAQQKTKEFGRGKADIAQLTRAWEDAHSSEVLNPRYAGKDLIAARTALGNLIDRLGVSPAGTVEGTQAFLFRESFTQSIFKNFSNKDGIIVKGIRYPLRSIFFRLEKMREVYNSNLSPVRTPIRAISDLRYKDLLKFGFSELDAKKLDKIIRESNVTNPNIVGLGESLSNVLRTGNNPLSRAYDNFMKLQSEWRFRKNPMFGMQSAVESQVWGSLWVKQVPGKEFIGNYVNRVIPFKKNIIQTLGEPSMREQQMVLDSVLENYNRQLLDAAASPEIYRLAQQVPMEARSGFQGVMDEMRFNKRNLDSNIWLGAANFSTVKMATNLMKSYAKRFGLELDQALDYRVVEGKRVYTNQWIVDEMSSAAQSIFGYETGLLTSPLMRTLNTIWFPVRFQTKTLIQTANWLGSLSPLSRLAVLSQWTQTANWMSSEEGQEWRKGNRGTFASFFNYTFAFEGIGKSVDAVTEGRLFGGNTGLIGGLPFGFAYAIARDLGYTSQDEQLNPTTGMPYDRKVVDETVSLAGFTTAVEDVILSMSPSMPLNTATGGAITVSTNRFMRDVIEQAIASTDAWIEGRERNEVLKDIQRGKTQVEPSFKKSLPIPANLFGTAEAKAYFEGEEQEHQGRKSVGYPINYQNAASTLYSSPQLQQLPEKERKAELKKIATGERAPRGTYVIQGRDLTLTDSDLSELKAIVFSEISNRSADKQEMEARVVINTALNRMWAFEEYNGKTKTLTQILQQPNQYQGYKSKQYQVYKSRDKNALSEEKAKLVDRVVEELKSGKFKDTTGGAYSYVHKGSGKSVTIVYDDTPLYPSWKKMGG